MNDGRNENDVHRLVVKFGGSSLADGTSIARALDSVVKKAREGVQIVVVVSAMGKTTDFLIKTAIDACRSKVSADMLDDVLAMGERTSARIFSAGLKARDQRSIYLDPSMEEWPIITDERFNNANPILPICERKVKETVEPLLEDGMIVVVPGFIGRTKSGKITTLGRGGSDVTALVLAKAIHADQVILVTDVKGIMTADPKIIKDAKKIDEISMDTLLGIADSGTKFIHKKALRYKSPEIDLKIISNSSGSLDAEGTVIHGSFPSMIIVDCYSKPAMAVTIVGERASESFKTIMSVLKEIQKASLPLLGMSINHNSLILYLPMEEPIDLLENMHSVVLKDERAIALAVKRNLAFIRIKGAGLEETPGVISRISDTLNSAGINIYGIFTITSSIDLFVDLKDREDALRMIKKSLESINESRC